MCAELHLVLVQGEVGHAAPKLKQLLAGVAVFPVLPDRIVHRLLGEVVFQFKGEDRQAIDEEPHVQRPLGLVSAVAKLPRDGEAVPCKALLRLLVLSRRRAVEKIEVMGTMLDAMSQHVDGAALGDLSLQPGQEPAPCRAVLRQPQRFGGPGLGGTQESCKLDPVDAVLTVIVLGIAAHPPHTAIAGRRFGHRTRRGRLAGMAGQRPADQPFQASFRGIGGHKEFGMSGCSIQPFSDKTSNAILI